jgi:hypothetical protein
VRDESLAVARTELAGGGRSRKSYEKGGGYDEVAHAGMLAASGPGSGGM